MCKFENVFISKEIIMSKNSNNNHSIGKYYGYYILP